MKKSIFIVIIISLLSVAIFSGCTKNLPSDAFCEQKIKQITNCNYILLDDWEEGLFSSKRDFTAYSYNPTLPENKDITGGWESGYITSDGEVVITFQS